MHVTRLGGEGDFVGGEVPGEGPAGGGDWGGTRLGGEGDFVGGEVPGEGPAGGGDWGGCGMVLQ